MAGRPLAVLVLVAAGLVAAAPAQAAGPCANPTVTGSDRDDRLRGTDGPDVIAGRGGDDVLIGLGSDDVLCGGPGQDRLRGGSGADRLHGGADAKVARGDRWVFKGDTLDGGTGSDLLDGGTDRRHRGSVDAITYEHSADGIEADLAVGTVRSKNEEEPETDTVLGPVAVLRATPFGDTVVGSDRAERLAGFGGSDSLVGAGGDDRILAGGDRSGDTAEGGPGDDVVVGGNGPDLLRGGPGNDRLRPGGGPDRTYAGSGADQVGDVLVLGRGQVVVGGPGRFDRLAGIRFEDARGQHPRHLTGRLDLEERRLTARLGDRVWRTTLVEFEDVATPRGDLWTVLGTDGPERITAGYLADPVRIHARGGNDRLVGSNADDVLNGGDGFDTGIGRGGRDRPVSIERTR